MKPHPVLTGAILFCYLVLAFLFSAWTEERQIKVRARACLNRTCSQMGRIAIEPASLDVIVVVPPRTDNRLLDVGVFCDGERVSGSTRTLSGDLEPPIFPYRYRNLGACEYLTAAAVGRADGSVTRAQAEPVIVLSRQ